MGVPTSEVGYTAAMPRRDDHEVHKDMWCHWTKKKFSSNSSHIKFNSITVHSGPFRIGESYGHVAGTHLV